MNSKFYNIDAVKIAEEIDKQIKNDNNILNIKEYKYLQYLVFKYCLIPNPDLSAS